MQQSTQQALENLKSTDPSVREAAIRDLSASTDPAALNALTTASQRDPDPRLRDIARQAALQMQANVTQQSANAMPGPATPAAQTPSNIPVKSGGSTPLSGSTSQTTPASSSGNIPTSGSSAQTATPSGATPGGREVFQMLWDCRFCGTTKLLGMDNRHCPNCGAAQDPAWRYFPSEADMHFVTNPKYSGADKICPFCGQPNSADANFCKDCGGDLSGAKEATRVDGVSTGMTGASGVHDDVVLKNFQREQAAIAGAKPGLGPKVMTQLKTKRGPLPLGCWAILVVVLACIGSFVFLNSATHAAAMSVSDMHWQHTIRVERYTTTTGSDWRDSLPSGAYNLSCHSEDRCHTETEQQQCGYTYNDLGNGQGERVPKYCDSQKQVCTTADKCSYNLDTWVFEKNLTSEGGVNDDMTWPNFSPLQTSGIGAERGTRSETYNVVFVDTTTNKTYTYSQSDMSVWQKFQIGQVYTVNINLLDRPLWDTLKLKQ